MNEAQWEQLVSVMARMAEGDRAAWVTLYTEFGVVLTGVVRRHLRRFGVEAMRADEVQGIVIDVCLALADCASAWDPAAGVVPWTWADKRVAKVVNRSVGQYADELDDQVRRLPQPGAASARDERAIEVFDGEKGAMCRLLRDAFDEAHISTRDRELLLETAVQANLGDPSPASTVADIYGMQPAAVRQAVKRAKDRIRVLASRDPRFAVLADVALFS